MNYIPAFIRIFTLLFSSILLSSCNGQYNANVPQDSTFEANTVPLDISTDENSLAAEVDSQEYIADCNSNISSYINSILQDKTGTFWFGTEGFGACKYDGDSLYYFSEQEGFNGRKVRGIVEDQGGNIWFGTSEGVTKYTGDSFINFTQNDGLIDTDVWSITIDSKGIIWVGTSQGVSHFDPSVVRRTGREVFTPFALPAATIDYSQGISSERKVHCIMEDTKGHIWFGTNGGAYIYDPSVELKSSEKSVSHISEEDGLPNNAIRCMVEDKEGNIWFGTHTKGVSRYNPNAADKPGSKSFTNFTEEGVVDGNEIWSIYEDKMGSIWFSAVGFGLYRYDSNGGSSSFTNFHKEEGLSSHALHCMHEDRKGQLWVGGWKGVFRLDPAFSLNSEKNIPIEKDKKAFFQVTKNGPWQ